MSKAPTVSAGSQEIVLIAAGFAVLHLLLGLALLTPAPYEGGDNAAYLALAKSLLRFGTYLELWDPAEPPSTLYPPLFPLVLASALASGLQSWAQLKVVTLCISATAVLLSVLWLRRVGGLRTALAGGLLLAISPGILAQASYVLSEGLFWLFTMLALWAASHVTMVQRTEQPASQNNRRRWIIVTALAALAAALTRSTGLPLIVAIASALLIGRHWRGFAAFAGITIPPLILWSVRGRLADSPRYSSYITMVDPYRPDLGTIDVSLLMKRIADNTMSYITEMAPQLIWSAENFRRFGILFVLIAIVWWAVRLVRKPDVLELWVLLYVGLLALWPETWAGERFVLALVPALIYYTADLVKALHGRSRKAALAYVITIAVFTAGVISPVLLARTSNAADCRKQATVTDEFECMEPIYSDFMRVAENSRKALPSGTVVISRKPTMFYAQSGLQSSMYPLSAEPARFFAAADSVNASYVVVDQLSTLAELYLNPIILGSPERFCVEEELSRDHALLMQILPTARPDATVADSTGFIEMPDCKDLR